MKPTMYADDLPGTLPQELAALIKSLQAKYGPAAVAVGMHVENLANILSCVKDDTMTSEERARAAVYCQTVAAEIVRALGMAVGAEPRAVFAVSDALQEFMVHASDEILGERNSPEAEAAAAAAIAKAKSNPTVH